MGYVVESYKHRLVIEICSASKLTCKVCTHRPCCRSKPRFIDWYLLLGVEADADFDVIRKRYHKLALQVHPDKNDHPYAEIAFKLLLDAYKCLSDAAKRSAFNAEKRKNAYPECLNLPLHHPSRVDKVHDFSTLKIARDRFREEARVIKTCIRLYMESPATKTHRQCIPSKTVQDTCVNLSSEKKESPIFDPSRYEFNGYPHIRCRVDKGIRDQWRYTTTAGGSPVFGGSKSSDMCLNRSRSVCLHS